MYILSFKNSKESSLGHPTLQVIQTTVEAWDRFLHITEADGNSDHSNSTKWSRFQKHKTRNFEKSIMIPPWTLWISCFFVWFLQAGHFLVATCKKARRLAAKPNPQGVGPATARRASTVVSQFQQSPLQCHTTSNITPIWDGNIPTIKPIPAVRWVHSSCGCAECRPATPSLCAEAFP